MSSSAVQISDGENGNCRASVESDGSGDIPHRMAPVAARAPIALDRMDAADPAELYRRQLAQERDRLSLLLDITNRIASNLDLHELLRAISATLRQVMECDGGVVVVLSDEKSGQPWVHALDFPESDGFVSTELLASRGGFGGRAFATLQPVIANLLDQAPLAPELSHRMIERGIRSVCCIPLVSRGRALGLLGLARRQEHSFRPEDAEFLGQVGAQIAIAIENALAYRQISELKDKLAQENLYLEQESRGEMEFEQIIGKSAALGHVLKLVQTVAPNDSTVLLLGETGTGKELIARAIRDHSRRQDRAFVKLNCAAIPTGLLESELFGHEKGAFTGAISQKIGRLELADQGTLFLDEVGDIPMEIQPKLLHTLQEREFERLGSTQTRKVNLRLIAATNRDLKTMVQSREFRSDLYYRLNVFPIQIPPLRERKEDIPLLVRYFVQRFARQMQKPIETIPSAALKELAAADWPGNIRELENFIERAVILTRGKSLHVPLAELDRSAAESPRVHPARSSEREEIVRIVRETMGEIHHIAPGNTVTEHLEKQRQQIIDVLRETKGRVGGPRGAAARMGLNRTTLLSRMRKLSIHPRRFA
jgi:formate hydrogenlyase transcriptional activator